LLSEAAKFNKDTAQFRHSISSTVDLRNNVREWCKLASVTLVQVPGSVEEERLFSKLAYIKVERRNILDGGHLNACLMLATQRIWDFFLHMFPYSKPMGKWADAKERRLAVHGSKHQQQGRQEQSAPVQLDSDSD
jgi:hypothetical protein